jgi:hypothetical protein
MQYGMRYNPGEMKKTYILKFIINYLTLISQ